MLRTKVTSDWDEFIAQFGGNSEEKEGFGQPVVDLSLSFMFTTRAEVNYFMTSLRGTMQSQHIGGLPKMGLNRFFSMSFNILT